MEASTTTRRLHATTQGDGQRRVRIPATVAMTPHSTAPQPDDHAVTLIPAASAYAVHAPHDKDA